MRELGVDADFCLYDVIDKNERDSALYGTLCTLRPREASVLIMRFVDNMTYREIGRNLMRHDGHGGILGKMVSAQTARHIEHKALRKLRSPIRLRKLKGFV